VFHIVAHIVDSAELLPVGNYAEGFKSLFDLLTIYRLFTFSDEYDLPV
jgi:hypothetical protein